MMSKHAVFLAFNGEGRTGMGHLPADFMIVGVAPPNKLPFHRRLHPFGSSTMSLVEKISQKHRVYVTNLIKEPVRKVYVADIRKWGPYLDAEIAAVQPQRILALGTEPAKYLCPTFSNLRADHGTFFPHVSGALVVPTFHPSGIYKDPTQQELMARDLQRFFTLEPEWAPYRILDSLEPLRAELEPGGEVILDVETRGLEDLTIIQLGVKPFGKTNFIFTNPSPELLVQVGKLFAEFDIHLVGHNLPFDLGALVRNTNWRFPRLETEDTMLLARVAGEEILSLKHLTTVYTPRPGSHGGGGWEDPQYLAEDLESTEALYRHFAPFRDSYAYGILRDLIPVVTAMRERGVYIDEKMLRQQREEAIAAVQETEAFLTELAGGVEGINWNSPSQVVDFLTKAGVSLTVKTASGNYSVAESVLQGLDHPAAKAVLELRGRMKLVSTYYNSYLKILEQFGDGCLHPRMILSGARTGRLSCRDPNLQQVPRVGPLKKVFVSRWEGGQYGLVDLSQAELRVAALISGDRAFAAALNERDVHRYLASVMFQTPPDQIDKATRKASKAVTFGLLYGGSPSGLAARSGLSEIRVAEVLRIFFEQFPQLQKWLNDQRHAIERGYTTSIFGRRRDLSRVIASEGVSGAYRKAVNTPIQSAASDIALCILRRADAELRRLHAKTRPLFGVHDSVIFEIFPGESDLLAEVIQGCFFALRETPLAHQELYEEIPFTGDLVVGPSWAAVEDTNENYAPTQVYHCSSLPHLLEGDGEEV